MLAELGEFSVAPAVPEREPAVLVATGLLSTDVAVPGFVNVGGAVVEPRVPVVAVLDTPPVDRGLLGVSAVVPLSPPTDVALPPPTDVGVLLVTNCSRLRMAPMSVRRLSTWCWLTPASSEARLTLFASVVSET